MSWKKYFTPVDTTGQMSVISSGASRPNMSRTNYSSYLPDVYSGHPNRLERYGQYDSMDTDSEVNAAFDILAEFCTQMNDENGTPFQVFLKNRQLVPKLKLLKSIYSSGLNLINFKHEFLK